jgi:hypothetical protein
MHTFKGQSHEKVGEINVWGVSLGPKLRTATGTGFLIFQISPLIPVIF